MPNPPPLPAEVLARVLRIAGIDGFFLVFIAGGFGALSVILNDRLGAIVGGLAAGAGLLELYGCRRLRAGEISGVNWLVRSQIVLLTVIVLYAVNQFFNYDPQSMLAQIERSLASAQRTAGLEVVSLGELLGLTNEQLIAATRKTAHTTYLAVGLATVICQGGLAFYYHRKKPAIYRALSKT